MRCRWVSNNIVIDHIIFTHSLSIIIPTKTGSWNVWKRFEINTLIEYVPNSVHRAYDSRAHCKEKFFPNSQMGLADHVNHSYARTLSDVSFISVTPRLQSSPIEIAFGQVSLFLFTEALLLPTYPEKNPWMISKNNYRFFLGCAAILAAAQPLKIVFVVVVVVVVVVLCCVVAAKSTFTQGLLT